MTTLIAGRASQGVQIHSLEHIPEWHAKVKRHLRLHRFLVTLYLTRLQQYDGFDWYALPDAFPDHFELVICDGPPGLTLGGRYGLLPVMGERISGATVLLDDSDCDGERDVLMRWQREYGVTIERIEKFAVATV